MSPPGTDAVIWGITACGRRFRPSDWAERLGGLTAEFGADHKLVYSPLLCPIAIGGARALIVGGGLETLEPRLHQFLLNFARDNDLQVQFVPGALAKPGALQPPASVAAGEPREPV